MELTRKCGTCGANMLSKMKFCTECGVKLGSEEPAAFSTDVTETASIPGRLTGVLQQWLDEQGWEEKPEFNPENQISITSFGQTVDDFSLQGFFEISEEAEFFKYFLYFRCAKAPENRLDEVQEFVNAMGCDEGLGSLQLLRNERIIRYYNAIDVTDAAFVPAHITNVFNTSSRAMSNSLPMYMAVCFGDKTAEEALADMEE